MCWLVACAALIALVPNAASISLFAQGYFLGHRRFPDRDDLMPRAA